MKSISWRTPKGADPAPGFYRQVFRLLVPLALQNLINVGITAADVLMLGRVDETMLSGASLGSQIQFIMMLIIMGITSGATVLTAQYWGQRDLAAIEKILGIALGFGVAVAAVFALLAGLAPGLLLRIFSNDPAVVAQGVRYLRVVAPSYLLMAVTQVYLYIMRSVERVLIATLVYACSLLVNIGVNALLIFGLFGAPRLGAAGAAAGTLVARFVELLLVMYYAHRRNHTIKVRFRYIWRPDRSLLRDFLRYSLPVVLNELMWGLGTSANVAIIGHLGSAAVAANSVAQVARELAQVAVFGIANAAAIILGKTIGEHKLPLARIYGRRLCRLTAVLGLAGSALMLVLRPIVPARLALGAEAQSYLKLMFLVMSYFVFCQALNSTLVVGVFRAGGDTRFGLALDVGTMWGCSIVLGALAAFVFKWSVPVVYIILLSDEVIKLPLCLKRYARYKWLKNITRGGTEDVELRQSAD